MNDLIPFKPYYQDDAVTIYNADCRKVLPWLGNLDAIITDPPYLNGDAVPIRGRGVTKRIEESDSVGMPWGYSLDWIDAAKSNNPKHWIVYANYKMLASLCGALEPQTVFVWRKSNAPRMTRPVPRMDCEFIVWSRTGGKCDRMGEFDSMVIDVPMLQAGCMASERILQSGSGKAIHPCQKPLAIVRPFVGRLAADLICDPFMGTGTTLVAAKLEGRKAVGIEINEKYCESAVKRLEQGVLF